MGLQFSEEPVARQLPGSTVQTAVDGIFRNDGMSEVCEFTILMPCLNEAETLASCISKARTFFARGGCTGEVLIADNGSTDRSRAIAAANGARVVHVTERGYVSALLGGIRAARGKYVIMGTATTATTLAVWTLSSNGCAPAISLSWATA